MDLREKRKDMRKGKNTEEKISWQKGLCECNTAMKCLVRNSAEDSKLCLLLCNCSYKAKKPGNYTLRPQANTERPAWDPEAATRGAGPHGPQEQRHHMPCSVGTQAVPCSMMKEKRVEFLLNQASPSNPSGPGHEWTHPRALASL